MRGEMREKRIKYKQEYNDIGRSNVGKAIRLNVSKLTGGDGYEDCSRFKNTPIELISC